jgi:catecholate siderophore receptor
MLARNRGLAMPADVTRTPAPAGPSPPAAARPTLGPVSVYVSSLLGIGAAHGATAMAPGSAETPDAAAADHAASNDDDRSLQEVTVSGVRPLLHNKLPQDLQDTPQSITVVSQRLMSEQAVTRLTDALKNVPGITLNAGEGAARGDTVNLRGFSAFNDFFLDGIRDAAVYSRDSFDLESVEVLKGPSAVLFGRGSTGGAINQVSKAPLAASQGTVTASLGSNDLYRATTDLNLPLTASSAVRLNAMGESSAIADRDEVINRRWGVAPSLALGMGQRDSLTLAYLHQQENNRPDAGIPFLDGAPAPVERHASYGLVSDRATTDVDIGTARFNHDFPSSLSIADTLRYAHYTFSFIDTMPSYGAHVPSAATPMDSILVGRDAPGSSGVQTNFTEQLDLRARFTTGAIGHTLSAGLEFARQTLDLTRYVNPFNSNNTWIAETPLLDPDPNEPLPRVTPASSLQDTIANSSAAYITDTMAFGRYLDLTAGFRLDRFAADYEQITVASGAVLHLDHVDRLGSPRAALVIKPTPMQSYYLSFGTSFDPSAEALSLTTRTANLGPVKAKTYEAGAKTGWLDGALGLTGALFRTEVDNAQTNDPDNPTVTVLNGDQRVDGLELAASGHLTQQWEIFSGYTYLDGKTIRSGTAAYVGQPLPNVARNALNLWTEYEFSSAWEFGAGCNWLDRRFADSGGSATIPGYVVWNAMLAYRVTPHVALQLNGFNLLNRNYFVDSYYTSAAENHVIPGAGRSVVLSIRLSLGDAAGAD